MLSDLQQRKISRLFDTFDADGNGYLEEADTERVAKRLAAARGWAEDSPAYAALRQLYQYGVDATKEFQNEEGHIDRESYIQFHEKMLNTPGAYDATVRQLADFIFNVLDGDGDGKITEDEVRVFYSAYSIDESLAPEAFRKMDMDGDGHISKSEVTDAVAQFYFSSDPDAPGNWLLGTY